MIHEQQFGKHHINLVGCLVNLGNICRQKKDLQTAAQHFERAVELLDGHDVSNNSHAVKALVALGGTRAQMNQKKQMAEALKLFQRAEVIEANISGTGSLAYAKIMQFQSSVHRALGNTGEASRLEQQVQAIHKAKR